MEFNINLVTAGYRCIINNKYSVVAIVSDRKGKHRYDTVEFYDFFENGKKIKNLPDLDETKVKNRILKLIKSIEEPLIKKKE